MLIIRVVFPETISPVLVLSDSHFPCGDVYPQTITFFTAACSLYHLLTLTLNFSGGSRGVPWVPQNPFLSFWAHASPASCALTSAVKNVLDSGTSPFQNPRSATEFN